MGGVSGVLHIHFLFGLEEGPPCPNHQSRERECGAAGWSECGSERVARWTAPSERMRQMQIESCDRRDEFLRQSVRGVHAQTHTITHTAVSSQVLVQTAVMFMQCYCVFCLD